MLLWPFCVWSCMQFAKKVHGFWRRQIHIRPLHIRLSESPGCLNLVPFLYWSTQRSMLNILPSVENNAAAFIRNPACISYGFLTYMINQPNRSDWALFYFWPQIAWFLIINEHMAYLCALRVDHMQVIKTPIHVSSIVLSHWLWSETYFPILYDHYLVALNCHLSTSLFQKSLDRSRGAR